LVAALFNQPFLAGYAVATPFIIEYENYDIVKSPLGTFRTLAICLPDHATIKSKQTDALYQSIDWQGFGERDLVIVEIRKQTAHAIREHQRGKLIPRNIILERNGDKKIGAIARCENKLEYVLIGKDQTQKRRWNLFPSRDSLYSTIDAMPMRRYEMKQRAGKN